MLIRLLYPWSGLLLCIVTALGVAAPTVSALPAIEVHFLNAGDGDAAWIGLPDGSTALIDCGPPEGSKQLLLQLQSAGLTTIDVLAPSRASDDVLGGCTDVVRYLNVNTVLWAPTTTLDATGRAFEAALTTAGVSRAPASAGWSRDFGTARLSLFNPSAVPTGSAADDSQVLLLEYGASGVLFAGAIHGAGEASVLAAGLGGRSITVLRTADHGVAGTSSSDFLRALFPSSSPMAIVLSYSPARGAPHPDAGVVDRLSGLHSAMLSTARNGAITATLGFDGSTTWTTER